MEENYNMLDKLFSTIGPSKPWTTNLSWKGFEEVLIVGAKCNKQYWYRASLATPIYVQWDQLIARRYVIDIDLFYRSCKLSFDKNIFVMAFLELVYSKYIIIRYC